MKMLRLKLYQETACYKKPAAYKVGETYPLPPYSTVKGMLHQALGADTYIPMQLSIQGTYESRVVDYQRHYFFKSNKHEEAPLVLDGLAIDYELQDMTTMPIYMHMLYGVELVLHVQASEQTMQRLYDAFHIQSPSISLGRWEDLVRVDECTFVECEDSDADEVKTVLPIYMPLSRLDEYEAKGIGVPYRLNWTYEIRQGVRQWDKIKVRYVPSGRRIIDADLRVDQDGYLVAFPKEMEG